MGGLIFLGYLVLCLWACVWLAKGVSILVPAPAWRNKVKVGVFLALIASPFVDEVIGKYQFEALCKANAIQNADVSKAKGRRVRFELGISRSLGGTIMPGMIDEQVYRDAESGEILIRHNGYYAFGGWLMRYRPLYMGRHHPMIFAGGCVVDYATREALFSKNGISLVN